MTEVVIPDSTTRIGGEAFLNCYNLTNVVLGKNVNYVWDNAFSGCNKLVEVCNKSSLNITTASQNYGYIGYYALNICSTTDESKCFVTEDGFVFYEDGETCYLLGYRGNQTDIVLPDSCNGKNYEIYKYAFYKQNSLTSVVISDGVTVIGSDSFAGCFSLTKIVIGENVKTINNTFYSCYKLVEVYNLSSLNIEAGTSNYGYVGYNALNIYTSIEEGNQFVTDDGYIFYENGETCYLLGYKGNETNLVLPESCNGKNYSVYQYAFYDCDRIVSVKIPDTVIEIGKFAFSSCSYMVTLEIGTQVAYIGEEAFSYCVALREVLLPSSVTTIGAHAFAYCYELEKIWIPISVKTWEVSHLANRGAFYSCNYLTIYCEAASQPSEWYYDWNYSNHPVVWGECEHTYGESVVYKPSCETDGYTSETCTKCGYENKHSIVEALGHSFGAPVVVAPTCTEKGYTTETCATCQKVNTYDYVSATGHNYDKTEVVAPTCTIKGYTVYTCANCGNRYMGNYTNVIEHSYNEVVTAPSCTEKGYTTYTCTTCGDSYIDNYTDVISHSYNEVVTAPTCTQKGYTTYTCTACGRSYRDNYTDVIEHSYSATVTAPTCTERGYTTYICTMCGYNYKDDFVDEKGHDYSATIISPTCVKEGYTIYECDVCGENYKTNYVDASGHSYINGKCECGAIEALMTWNISASDADNVFAYLTKDIDNDGYYKLTISGTGTMKVDYQAPWESYKNKIVNVIVENGVTNICRYAFHNCDNLTDVTIGNDVIIVDEYAFYACANLKNVSIGSCVTSINEGAFQFCRSLTEIIIPNSVTTMGYNAFYGCSNLLFHCEAKSKPSGWDLYYNYSNPIVWDCKNNDIADDGYIHLIVNGLHYGIKNGVATVMRRQLSDTSKVAILSSISYKNVSYDVTSIGDSAFYGCSSLTEIVIPNSVLKIGQKAFYGCSSLTEIVIPNSVQKIEREAFYGCSSLTEIVIPDGIETINAKTFQECTSLVKIVIPDSVRSFYGYAFYNCSSLTQIEIPNRATEIWEYTFHGCSSLTKITIPDSVKTIGNYAFCGCSNLTEIVIPVGVTTIGTSALAGCLGITKIVIPDSVTSIGGYAFSNCSALTELEIPVGVTTIGASALSGCSGITKIVIPDSVTSIGDSVFYRCLNLKEVVLPKGTKSISESMFQMCSSLTEIAIPNRVTSIEKNAFYGCSSLTEIVIPNGVTFIYDNAFYGCSSLKKILIPNSVSKIYQNAFYNCTILRIYCEATSKPRFWDTNWNKTYCLVRWGHVHKALNDVENNGDVHAYDCECGLVITEEHLFEDWVKINSTTKQSTCICGAKNKMTIDEESDKVKIDIVVSKDTFDAVGTVLIPEILEMIEGKEFEISSTEGVIVLDSAASSKIAGTSGKVSIGIKDVTTDTETKNGHKVYSITVNDENGNPILPSSESSTNGTVTLSLKYYKGLVKEQIKVAYRDENGKLEYMQVESYNAETGEITFKTNHLSDYVVYCEEIDANEYFEKIFTFKGYSFNENGAMAVGFDVDYESLEIYETLTGETVRIGVAFASYILLNGQNPINDKGHVITLAQGAVAKRELTNYSSFSSYDFVVQGITEALREHPLVIAAYLSNGEDTKFVQANGVSDTVTGITYNEAKGGQK